MQTKSKLFLIKWNMNRIESWKDEPRLCSTSASPHAQNIPTREQLWSSSQASACVSGVLGEKEKICNLPTRNSNYDCQILCNCFKQLFFISQPRPVDEGIRSLEHLSQRLLLLKVRHRLITALNILLRPSWNLEKCHAVTLETVHLKGRGSAKGTASLIKRY